MAGRPEERVTVTPEELAVSNMLVQEALVRVLVRKGLLTNEEVLREVAVSEESGRRTAGGN